MFRTVVALAAATAFGLALAMALPLDSSARLGAALGLLVSASAAIVPLLLKARALSFPVDSASSLATMSVAVRALASGLIIRLGFAVLGLVAALQLGLSGQAYVVGFFFVYFVLQVAEVRWLLSVGSKVTQ